MEVVLGGRGICICWCVELEFLETVWSRVLRVGVSKHSEMNNMKLVHPTSNEQLTRPLQQPVPRNTRGVRSVVAGPK